MQTFLPYPDFKLTAWVLDDKRLGKQRIEAFDILVLNSNIVNEKEDLTGSWASAGLSQAQIDLMYKYYRNHPACKMWRGYEVALYKYGLDMCHEWARRGYEDHTLERFNAWRRAYPISTCFAEYPPWLGDPAFHLSHQSNLVRKNPTHYRLFWADIPDNLEYVWPVT